MKSIVVSFHNGNLDPEIVPLQKQVMDKIGIEITQWQSTLPHGEMMDEYVASLNGDWDVLTLLDADALILDKKEWGNLTYLAWGTGIISGGAHNANWTKRPHDYASPACMVIGRETYGDLGHPKFGVTPSSDAGQMISEVAREKNRQDRLDIIKPVSVAFPMWKLEDGSMFGHGTDYGVFYHGFEGRVGGRGANCFKQKCLEILTSP